MYTDIDKQLNEITKDLKESLIAAHAIDDAGRATNIAKFHQILDSKIAQCEKILATTEHDGVTVDKYGANLVFNRIARLQKMKEMGALEPDSDWFNHGERGIGEPKAKMQKKAAFNAGLQKLLAKIRASFAHTNDTINDR